MKCLRCKAEMKQYIVNKNLGIMGPTQIDPIFRDGRFEIPHNPNSAFICEECGYVEFSMKEYEEQYD